MASVLQLSEIRVTKSSSIYFLFLYIFIFKWKYAKSRIYEKNDNFGDWLQLFSWVASRQTLEHTAKVPLRNSRFAPAYVYSRMLFS